LAPSANAEAAVKPADADPGQPDQPSGDSAAKANKAAETAKTTRSAAKSKTSSEANQEGEVVEFTSDDPDIPDGGVVIRQKDKDGRMRTLRVNPGKPPAVTPPNIDFPDGFDPGRLTPEQRRRVQRAIRQSQQQQPSEAPPEQP
jgi:hypothetical protein